MLSRGRMGIPFTALSLYHCTYFAEIVLITRRKLRLTEETAGVKWSTSPKNKYFHSLPSPLCVSEHCLTSWLIFFVAFCVARVGLSPVNSFTQHYTAKKWKEQGSPDVSGVSARIILSYDITPSPGHPSKAEPWDVGR